MHQQRIAFGLGSNIGDRAAYLHRAYHALSALPIFIQGSIEMSPIIETPALLPDNAPAAWDSPYLNCVVVGIMQERSYTTPEAILVAIKDIEQQLGRQKRSHWGPREIDIDILTIEGITWASPTLQLPHPAAHTRFFVLAPLCAVWADAPLAEGQTARSALPHDTIIWWQP